MTPTPSFAGTAPVQVEIERVRRCPECGGSSLRRWSSCRDLLHRLDAQEFEYSRCRSCALVFLTERPVARDAGLLYPDDYAPYVASMARSRAEAGAPDAPTASVPAPSSSRSRIARRATRAIDRVLPDRLPGVLHRLYEPRDAAVLVDYGCGGPGFLDGARRRGWTETIGVDMNAGVVERVGAAGHRGVLASEFAATIDDASVTVVRVNHVFEHLYDPEDVLRVLRAKLAPGGTVHIAVPNGASVWAALFRSAWYNADPRHLVLYAPANLRTVAARAGFTEVEIVHEVITRDIARSWGYVRERRGRLDAGEVEALADDARLRRLLVGPARISAAAGRGDRFHALLRG